jgi:hypothetical protein
MSGYSRDAVAALMVGKDLNLILFDGADVDVCMDKSIGFKKVLSQKLRLASEEGLVYPRLEQVYVSTSDLRETAVVKQRSGRIDHEKK